MAFQGRVLERIMRRAGREPATREIRVRVRGRFEPEVIRASAGQPLRLVFRREETAASSERVVLPAFGRSATLPPFEDVALEILPEEAGQFELVCELGLPRGLLVVSGDTGPGASLRSRRTRGGER